MENFQIITSLVILLAFAIWLIGFLDQKPEFHITVWTIALIIWALLIKVLHIQNLTTSILMIWWVIITWYWLIKEFKL